MIDPRFGKREGRHGASRPALRRAISYVDVTLPYLSRADTAPYRYMGAPPPGVPREVGTLDHRATRVWSGWGLGSDMTLDGNGFVVGRHPTPFSDFWNPEAIERDYLPEMTALALRQTGANRALVFDFNVRHAPSVRGPSRFLGKPARLVHNDYTAVSGPQRLKELMHPDDAARALRHRFAIINLWRPIRGPLRDAPLAICDTRTVSAGDLVVSTLIYPDRRGEVFRLTFNPAHRWYYFPDMSADEVLLFKSYDSADDGRARFTPHTAFDDPTCPSGSPPRQSIEARALLMWS